MFYVSSRQRDVSNRAKTRLKISRNVFVLWHLQVCVCVCGEFLMMPADCMFLVSTQDLCVSPGYDVQSASTRDGVLYITGAPRYNHTGRVVIYRLNKRNKIVVSQILKGEQVSLSASTVRLFSSDVQANPTVTLSTFRNEVHF